MHYDRTIIAYHGCERRAAEAILSGEAFTKSENAFDWLGSGIYFWEYGPDRAIRWAENKYANTGGEPAVVGAVIQLGDCFDLLDTRFTRNLAAAYPLWKAKHERSKRPTNRGKLALRDCAVFNWYFELMEREQGTPYDTARAAFIEGAPVYPGSIVRQENHIQIAVRNAACIVGVFRPMMVEGQP